MDQVEISKLFDLAIGREVEAYNFYKGVSERVEDPKVKEIFAKLASEEKGHEAVLQRFKGDPESVVTFKPPPDYKVAESVEVPALSLEMIPADAIALAMKKEQQAVEFYTNLAEWSQDAAQRSTYQNLAGMERTHKARLESLFVDIGYTEVW